MVPETAGELALEMLETPGYEEPQGKSHGRKERSVMENTPAQCADDGRMDGSEQTFRHCNL